MDRKPQHRISQPMGEPFAVALIAIALALGLALFVAHRLSTSLQHSAASILDPAPTAIQQEK